VQERLGYPTSARLLVIHADDVGMAHAVNRATFEALEHGWVTSASILVPCPWMPEVARWAQSHPNADLGIHLALNSEWTGLRWGPVTSKDKVPSLLDAQGYFPLVETTVAEQAKLPEVELELRNQIDRARALGIHASHLDTHMLALLTSPDLAKVYENLGREYGLPIRLESKPNHPPVPQPADQALLSEVVSIDPGVAIDNWLDAYKKMLGPLKPGVYQLTVHLAYADDEMHAATWDHPDYGSAWRQADFDLVQSPEFRQFLKDQGFVLVSWKDLARALPADYRASRR
jgi:chitin disaccharide deacetylase